MLEKLNAPVKFLSFLCANPSFTPFWAFTHRTAVLGKCVLSFPFSPGSYALTVFSLSSSISEKPILTHWTELGAPAMSPNEIL